MIALWMLYAAAVTLALCAAAAAAERSLRMADRPARGVWMAALVGSVALPILTLATGPISLLPTLAGDAAGSGAAAPDLAELAVAAGGAAGSGTGGAGGPAPIPAFVAELAARLEAPLLSLWIALGVVFGVRLAVEWWRGRRRREEWRPARLDGRRVLVAAEAGPALTGVLRPEIVVPAWFEELPGELRKLALRHEESHRRVGDPWLALVAELLRVLLSWNPGIHWAAARLRRAVEMDCDRRLLRAGADRGLYGRLLLMVGGRRSVAPASGAVALTERGSDLRRRITMLGSNDVPWRRLRMAGTALAALVAVAVACETPVPPAEESPPAAGEEASATAEGVEGEGGAPGGFIAGADSTLKVGSPDAPLVVIDGVILGENVPMSEINALDIEKVEVIKGAEARAEYGDRAANGVVMITATEGEPPGTTRSAGETGGAADESGSGTRADSEAAGGARGTVRPAEPESGTGESTVGVFRGVEVQGPAGSLRAGSVTARGVMALRGVTGASEEAPLVVVDGVIMGRDVGLEQINAMEIEKVEVVKGEDARALYGERAADGLIQITTEDGG